MPRQYNKRFVVGASEIQEIKAIAHRMWMEDIREPHNGASISTNEFLFKALEEYLLGKGVKINFRVKIEKERRNFQHDNNPDYSTRTKRGNNRSNRRSNKKVGKET